MADNLVFCVMLGLPFVTGVLLYFFFVCYRQHAKSTYRWPRLIVGNLLLLAFLLSLCVLAGETYYRFWYDASDSNGLTKTHQRWLERHYYTTINKQGVRDNVDYSAAIPPGKRRVMFLGDSFTFGHGIANVEDRFANLIRKRRSDWDINLAGAMGYNTPQEITVLFHCLGISHTPSTVVMDPSGRIVLGKDSKGRSILGKDSLGRAVLRDGSGSLVVEPDSNGLFSHMYQFDIVVLVFNLNDIQNFMPGIEAWEKQIYKDSLPGYLGQHSFLFNTVHYRLYAAFHPEVARFSSDAAAAYDPSKSVWKAYRPELSVLQSLVTTGGGRLLVVTFPYMDQLGKDYPFRATHRYLDAYWQSVGVPHLDLLNVFERRLTATLVVNRYDAHPNEKAHAIAAEAILPFIERNMSPAPR